jgi:hypothetical protein
MRFGRQWGLMWCGLAAAALAHPLLPETRQVRPASERLPGPVVDFVAVEHDGTPVAALQASEIEVRVDGRVRTVRSLRRVATAPIPAGPSRLPRPFGTNADVVIGRSFVLLVDEESFAAGQEPLLRNAVDGLLAEFTAADRGMFAVLPFGGVTAAFTSETARLRGAVGAFAAQGTRRETGSDMACRTRRFLESLDGFLTAHAGRSAPLTVVVFTAGLAAPRRDAPMALAPGMCELLVNHFERITVTAGAARANVYVLQPADIAMSSAGWRETIGGRDYLGSDNPLEGIEHFAGATGAARLALDGTGSASLLRVARESAAYFEAEIEPERREIVGRSRPLSVRVRRGGVTVRARPEITFAAARRTRVAARLAVGELLAAPAPSTGLDLRAAGFTVRERGGQLRVGVVVEPVEPAALTSLGVVLLDRGDIVGRWFAADPVERPLLGAIAARPGRYRLRAAAIDESGRFGVAEDDVEVGLTAVGPLSLGSLLLGVSRDGTVQPQLQFGHEPTAIASFDLYGGTSGMGLSALLEVYRDPAGPPITAVPLTLARADESRVVATAAVPVGALPPGDYLVRGIITLEDGTSGRVERTLRKFGR